MERLLEKLEETGACPLKIIHIDAVRRAGCDESEMFEDFLEDESAYELFPWMRDDGDSWMGAYEFMERMNENDAKGWLILMGYPLRDYYSESAWSAYWSHYTFQWFHGDTYEKALEAGAAWAEGLVERDKAQYEFGNL